MRRLPVFLSGLLCWLLLGAGAPAHAAPKLSYALLDVDTAYGLTDAATLPQARRAPADTSRALPGRPGSKRPLANRTTWHMTVDAGITADSNVANTGADRFVAVQSGGDTSPVIIDPSLRARSGSGREAGLAAGVKLRLSDGLAFAVDAEGRAIDYKGGRNDDISYLLAGGPELTWSSGVASVQLLASDNWYGGTSTNRGVGVRARIQTELAEGRRVSLSIDARTFDSGYGREFGGTQAGATLGGSATLDPVTTGWLGLYARREWLRSDPYSNLELGAYGGASRYLSEDFTGTLTAGISRTRYDAPLLYLSSDARQDWRVSAGAQLTMRRAIGLGLYPSLSYTYNRTDGSIDFFDAERHRVRLGVQRRF